MKRETDFDYAIWEGGQGVLENDEAYCLSAESGVSSMSDLKLSDELREKVRSSLLIKTSGSTGHPKWVVHSKQAILEHAALVNDHLNVSKGDVFGVLLPTYHVGGLGVIARAHVSGARLAVYVDKWSANACVTFLDENKVSVLSLVPTQLVDIVNEVLHCPESVRVVVIGGGKLEKEICDTARGLGWNILESYGMTETGSQIATGEIKESGYLQIIDGWQVCLNDERRLKVKGHCLFKGYLVGIAGGLEFIDPKVDGWFVTSDLADIKEIDGESGIKFLGRIDQQVKVLGELVDIYALEHKLREILQHEVAIIPLPDERRGMKLFPIVEDASFIATIIDLGWSGLYRLEKPVIVPNFPRNTMGKLQRVKLAEVVESIVILAD